MQINLQSAEAELQRYVFYGDIFVSLIYPNDNAKIFVHKLYL